MVGRCALILAVLALALVVDAKGGARRGGGGGRGHAKKVAPFPCPADEVCPNPEGSVIFQCRDRRRQTANAEGRPRVCLPTPSNGTCTSDDDCPLGSCRNTRCTVTRASHAYYSACKVVNAETPDTVVVERDCPEGFQCNTERDGFAFTWESAEVKGWGCRTARPASSSSNNGEAEGTGRGRGNRQRNGHHQSERQPKKNRNSRRQRGEDNEEDQ